MENVISKRLSLTVKWLCLSGTVSWYANWWSNQHNCTLWVGCLLAIFWVHCLDVARI